jgi:ABC-type multidrug transport system fused ATPase/permease subunit
MKAKRPKELIVSLDSGLYGPKNLVESLALIFNENVKFDKFLIHKQVENIQGFSNKYVHQRSCQPYKVFPTNKKYDLKPYLGGILGGEIANLFSVLVKYGDRGYRFILQEVGFLTQNISLLTESLGLNSCILGSYIDENINRILTADGTFETIQNVSVQGTSLLRDVSLAVNSGEVVALLGQNGSGKTTFVELLCNMMKYSVRRLDLCRDCFVVTSPFAFNNSVNRF